MMADTKYVRDSLFPLKHTIRVEQIDLALKVLEDANLIGLGDTDTGKRLWLIRPERLNSVSSEGEGDYRGSRSSGGREAPIVSQKNTGSENGVADKSKLGIADEFGITDSEVNSNREAWNAVESQARKYGLSTSIGAIEVAMDLVNQYGLEWVLEAIGECVDSPRWSYVKAILEKAKKRGSVGKKKLFGARDKKNVDDIQYDGENISKWWGGLSE